MKGYIARKTVSFQKAILYFGNPSLNASFNGSLYNPEKTINVVLQGSILGRLLFILYKNSIE